MKSNIETIRKACSPYVALFLLLIIVFLFLILPLILCIPLLLFDIIGNIVLIPYNYITHKQIVAKSSIIIINAYKTSIEKMVQNLNILRHRIAKNVEAAKVEENK